MGTQMKYQDAFDRLRAWSADDGMAPFHAEDGCWARAQRITDALGSDLTRKIWVFSTSPEALSVTDRRFLPDSGDPVYWSYHVAALVTVPDWDGSPRVVVLDPALGMDKGPMPIDDWLNTFVHGKHFQAVTSPAGVPTSFKYRLHGKPANTAAADDESGEYDDPYGDWHGLQWNDKIWEPIVSDPDTRSDLDNESEMPSYYVTESKRRRERGQASSVSHFLGGLFSQERLSALPERRVARDRVTRSAWRGPELWVGLERDNRWLKARGDVARAIEAASGRTLEIETNSRGEIISVK
jgi:hypothetical protein